MGSQKHLQEASSLATLAAVTPFGPFLQTRAKSERRISHVWVAAAAAKLLFRERDNARAIVLLNQSDRVHQLQMCMHNNECRFSIGGATLISGRCRCATAATVAALRSSHHRRRRRGSIGAKGPRGPRRVPRLRTCTCATAAADTAN
jgi:hypothetical protein